MKWITIGQYFYRLYIAILLILLVPIISFILIYGFFTTMGTHRQLPWTTLLNLSAPAIIFLLIQFLIFNKKIKSIRKDQGLRLKLEKYFHLTIVRYTLIAIACLVLACGFYVTHDDRLTGLFVAILILLGALWPRPAKVCSDLKLRGDEREMVYYQKDHF